MNTSAPSVPSVPHTESPWAVLDRAEGKGNNLVIRAANGGDERAVCEVVNEPWHSTQEVEANARLIAAAPDLLAALEQLKALAEAGVIHRNETGKPQWSLTEEIKNITRAAIAKATGVEP